MLPDSGGIEHNWNLEIYTEDEPYSTPVEILSEFLFAFMSHDYKSALHYCTLILQYEPDNKLIQDFYPLIQEKLHFDSYDSDEFADSERSNTSSKSDNSTEYFSSTSPYAESTSAFSSFSSEEETSQN
ncbi:glutamate-rich protein 2-like [Uloborus diversus]|uniref:glutamate-rich protein 2-like n=1 Tax=Uloborus diversus TaxID=327109 RepID=UPI00240A143F|nr:glutamate-rich protein 2-like [Uloborus diversus]